MPGSLQDKALRDEFVKWIEYVLELRLGRVLAQRAHHRPQLLRRDRAIAILVEKGERLLELGDLLLGQLLVTHD